MVLFLTLATGALTTAASTLAALKSVIVAAKEVGEALGLRKPAIEDGLTTIPIEDLTDADAARLAAPNADQTGSSDESA